MNHVDDCQKEHQASYVAEQDKSIWGPDGPQQGRNECVGVSPMMQGGNDISAPIAQGGGGHWGIGGAGAAPASGGLSGPGPAGPDLRGIIDRQYVELCRLKEEALKRQIYIRDLNEDLKVMAEVAHAFAKQAIRQNVRPAFGVSYREAYELFSDILFQLQVVTGEREVKGEASTNSASRDKHCRLMTKAIGKEMEILDELIRSRKGRVYSGEEAAAALAARIRAQMQQERQAQQIGRAAAKLDAHGYLMSRSIKRVEGPGPGEWYQGYDPNVAEKPQ